MRKVDSEKSPLLCVEIEQPSCYSNRRDCQRYSCPETPWNWASHWVLEQAGLTGHQRVVDLGAGDNPILRRAYESQCQTAYLVDLTPNSATGLAGSIYPIAASIDELPFADESIDVVLSVSVLEHLSVMQRRKAMAQIQRVLRPGGRAVLTIGVPFHADAEAQHLFQTMAFFTDRHCGVYFPIDIIDMLTAAPKLRHSFDIDLATLPGGRQFDAQKVLEQPDLCTEAYRDYPPLAAVACLAPVVVAECGLVLTKTCD